MSETLPNPLSNAQEFKDRVTETVRASFGMLIPEEDFKALVDNEVKAFFEDPGKQFTIVKVGGSYGSTWSISTEGIGVTPFRIMVWTELQSLFSSELRKRIREKENMLMCSHMDEHGHEVGVLSEALEKRLTSLVPEIVTEMFRGIAARVVGAQIDAVHDHVSNMHPGQY